MTIGHILAILRARWFSALLMFAIVAGGVTALGAYRPKQYTAVASVMVDAKPDPIAGMALGGNSPSFMITQVDVIQSMRVARRVVRILKLDEHPALRTSWQEATQGRGSIEDWVAARLRGGLDVRPSRGSNVINIAYTGSDPAFAAAIANTFVKSYLSTTVDLRVNPAKEYSTFFDERAKQSREELEQVQAKLSAFQRANGLIATDERYDGENTRLAELSSQAVALEAVVADSGSRQNQTGSNSDRMQEVLNNPVVASLMSDLSRQEVKLEELSSRLGEAHPQVIELRSNISGLRSKVEAATSRVSGSVGVNNNVNQTRLAQLRASIAEQRAKVLRLKAQRDEAAVIQRDVENARRAYDGVLARLNQTNLESQSAQTNMTALEYAIEPTQPSSISLTQSVLIGVLAGLVVAVITALTREWRDRRLRTQEELPLLVNQPLIGVVPAFNFARVSNSTRRLAGAAQLAGRKLPRLPAH